ncbi:MAG: hypothetical protein R6X22_10860 [Gemmatimonadota bacterium]
MSHPHWHGRSRRALRTAIAALGPLLVAPPGGPPAVAAQEVPAAGPITLRIGPRAGARAEYRYEKHLDLRMPPELGGDVTTRTSLRLAQEVEETSLDSVALRAEILEVRFEVEPAPADPPDLRALDGLRFRLVTTPAGRLLRVEMPGASGPLGRALREQVESWFRELGFPALPAGPARVGDAWTDTTRVPLASLLGLRSEAQVLEIRTTTLTGFERGPGGRTARLEVRTEWSGTQGPVEAPDLRVEGSGTQTVEFEADAGRFRRAAGTSRVVVLLFDGTGAPARRIEAAGRHETRLVNGG